MRSHTFPEVSLERLMRSLRNKCSRLAKISNLHNSRHALSEYYAGSTVNYTEGTWNDALNMAPLSVIPPPEELEARSRRDKDVLDAMELSKAIYGVRASFQDIIAKTSNGASSCPTEGSRIPSLASLCAISIGQQTVDGCYRKETEQSLDGRETESEQLYGAIPNQYKRDAAIAHGVESILQQCPHIPTLLSVVLDICLSIKLETGATAFLKALFRASTVVPARSTVPKISHKAHSSFLVDLRKRWMDAGFSSGTFLYHLLGVLLLCPSPRVVQCKALDRLVTDIIQQDLCSFFWDFCCPIMISSVKVANSGGNLPDTRKAVNKQLCAWLEVSFWTLYELVDTPVPERLLASFEDVCSTFVRTNVLNAVSAEDRASLESIICCKASCILTKSRVAAGGAMTDFLRTVCIRDDTFDQFVGALFSDAANESDLKVALDLTVCKTALLEHANALRSLNFKDLEVALLHCVLRHIEDNVPHAVRGEELDAFKTDLEQRLSSAHSHGLKGLSSRQELKFYSAGRHISDKKALNNIPQVGSRLMQSRSPSCHSSKSSKHFRDSSNSVRVSVPHQGVRQSNSFKSRRPTSPVVHNGHTKSDSVSSRSSNDSQSSNRNQKPYSGLKRKHVDEENLKPVHRKRVAKARRTCIISSDEDDDEMSSDDALNLFKYKSSPTTTR